MLEYYFLLKACDKTNCHLERSERSHEFVRKSFKRSLAYARDDSFFLKHSKMQIIRNLNQANIPPLVLTIGNFDGVHLGHLEIINKVKKIAKEKNIASAILTFEPHPISFFKSDRPKDFRINSLAQKLKIFQDLDIDFVITLPFNQDLANVTAHNFIEEILAKSLNTKHLVVGYDFIFGKNRQGNFEFLEKEAPFELSRISAKVSILEKSEQICSSSLIRKLINSGEVFEARKFLTRNFSIQGIVTNGRKLANQLGFPTVNLTIKPHIIKPKFGVYKTQITIPSLDKTFPSITNFGIKPTIEAGLAPLYETHILNFNQDIYEKKVSVEFIDFIRDEKKFASIEELKEQIRLDVDSIFKSS